MQPLAVHVVWSSQLGAGEEHVPGGARLMLDPRVRHYWDDEQVAGNAFQDHFGLSAPAWDVWMLFAPGVVWEGDAPPAPDWWEHQLGGLDPGRRLDPERFAARARELAAATASPESPPRRRQRAPR